MSFQIHPFPPATDGHYYAYGTQGPMFDPGPFAYGSAHYFYIPNGLTPAGSYYSGGIVKTTDGGTTWSQPDPLVNTDWDLDLFDGRGQPWTSSYVTRIGDDLWMPWINNQANDGYHLPLRVAKFSFATDSWTIYVGGTPPTGNGPMVSLIYYDWLNQYPYFMRGGTPACNANGKLCIFYNGNYTPTYKRIHMVLYDPVAGTWGTEYTVVTTGERAYPFFTLYDSVEDRVHVWYTYLYQTGGGATSWADIYHAVVNPNTGALVSSGLVLNTIYISSTGCHWPCPVLGEEDGVRKICFLSFVNETEALSGRLKVKLFTYNIGTASWSSEYFPYVSQLSATQEWDWTCFSSTLTSQNNSVGFLNGKLMVFFGTYNEAVSGGDWNKAQISQLWKATRDGVGGWRYCMQHSEGGTSKRKWFGPQFRSDATLGNGIIAYAERYDTMTYEPHTQIVKWHSLVDCETCAAAAGATQSPFMHWSIS